MLLVHIESAPSLTTCYHGIFSKLQLSIEAKVGTVTHELHLLQQQQKTVSAAGFTAD
jgi:hypothetical protein